MHCELHQMQQRTASMEMLDESVGCRWFLNSPTRQFHFRESNRRTVEDNLELEEKTGHQSRRDIVGFCLFPFLVKSACVCATR